MARSIHVRSRRRAAPGECEISIPLTAVKGAEGRGEDGEGGCSAGLEDECFVSSESELFRVMLRPLVLESRGEL